MKKLITIVILLAITISCSETKKNKTADDNQVVENKNDAFLTALIDGEKFYTDAPVYFSSQNIISLAAVSENEKIRIYINYNNGPTTYTFGKGISNSDNMVYTNNKVDWLAAKTNGEGTITFAEKGGFLVGKFNFTGVNKEDNTTKKITDGEFKVRKGS